MNARSDSRGSAGSIAFTAVLLSFTLVLLATSARLATSAAIVPRIVGAPLAVLLAYVLVRDMRARTRHPPAPTSRSRDEASAILWLLALPVLATLLGFVIGPSIHVLCWLRFRGGERIAIALAAAALTAVTIVLVFGELLGVRLPHGLLAPLLG